MRVKFLWADSETRPALESHLAAEGYGTFKSEWINNVANVQMVRRSREDEPENEKYPSIRVTRTDGSERTGFGRILKADGNNFGSVCTVRFRSRDEEIRTRMYQNVIGATWVERENRFETWEELKVLYWKAEDEVVGVGSINPDYAVIRMPNRHEVVGTHPLKSEGIDYESDGPLRITGRNESGEKSKIPGVCSVSTDEFSIDGERNYRVYTENGIMRELAEIDSVEGKTGRFQTIAEDESYREIRTQFGFLGGTLTQDALYKITVSDSFGNTPSLSQTPMNQNHFYKNKSYYSVRSGQREQFSA